MNRWFRHYAGMMRDEKLVRVAVKAAQPIERVIWVWGALLESASEVNDGGRYDFDAGEAAYFLRCDGADVVSILTHLEDSGRIAKGMVVKWGDRQFDSDSSRERQRLYRERQNRNQNGNGNGNGHIPEDDGHNPSSDVTAPSRDGELTLQEDREQITDTPSLRSGDARARDAVLTEFEREFWPAFPNKVGKPAALKAWRAARKRGVDCVEVVAGLSRYIAEKPPDRPWLNPATFLNQERWNDQPGRVETIRPNGTGPPKSRSAATIALERMGLSETNERDHNPILDLTAARAR